MTQTTRTTGPYAGSAWEYRRMGFTGVIPVGRGPAQKSPPVAGYTGWAGIDPSGADVQAWVDGREGARNIGWHVPRGYAVVDVDAYHRGAESLAKLEDKVGSVLPRTWTSTARGADSPSRHWMFRAVLPAGRTWRDHPGDGIDMLHVGHRYAVVWPSVNPETGAEYLWYDPEGELYEGIPDPAWFAELPAEWVEELSQPGEPLDGVGATDEATQDALERFRLGTACPRVERHLAKELDRILRVREGAGSLHDPGQLYPLVAYGLEGHAGVREALSRHQAAYVKARVDSRGESEGASDADWWRMVRGAVGKKLHASGGVILTECDCGEDTPEESAAEETDPVDALLARMLTREQLEHIPRPRPLIEGLLDLDSESWIIGAPGGFKSFVALDWACHVATGKTWRGQATVKGPVVYVVAEGAKGIRQRVLAWEATYEARADDLLCLPEPVQVKDGDTDKTGKPSRAWRVLVEACHRLQPVLIVLDTQARITVGLEENSNTSMGVLVEAVRQLKQATGACVLVVHHTGRNGEDARGASALDGAQDTEIRVDRPSGRNERRKLTATISVDKQKDGDESASWPVQLHVVAVGEQETSLALGVWDPFCVPAVNRPDWVEYLTENQRDVTNALLDHADGSGATHAQVMAWIKERRARYELPPMAKTSYHSAVRDLVKQELVVRLGARIVLAEHLDDSTS